MMQALFNKDGAVIPDTALCVNCRESTGERQFSIQVARPANWDGELFKDAPNAVCGACGRGEK